MRTHNQAGEFAPNILGGLNIEELADKINIALANFEGLKDQSVVNLGKIQERYTVQSVYQTLLDKIENTEMSQVNSLRHVKCLLDTNLPSQPASSFLRKVKNKPTQIGRASCRERV